MFPYVNSQNGYITIHTKTILIFLLTVLTISISSDSLSKTDTIDDNFLPGYHNKFVSEIPDYYQRSKNFGGFPDNGAVYCGPVSVSNSLVWFAKHGFDNIINISGDTDKEQYDLIHLLGSSQYINTGKEGSSPQAICNGVSSFLSERGYKAFVLNYYGWRTVSSKFNTEITVPDLNIAKNGIANNCAVWLNIGWYRYSKKENEYKRSGGHWVTMTGYSHNKNKLSENTFIINDPDSRHTGNEYISLERIKSGNLTCDFSEPVKAAGFYKWKHNSKYYGIIDGFIILKIDDHSTVSSIFFDCIQSRFGQV